MLFLFSINKSKFNSLIMQFFFSHYNYSQHTINSALAGSYPIQIDRDSHICVIEQGIAQLDYVLHS